MTTESSSRRTLASSDHIELGDLNAWRGEMLTGSQQNRGIAAIVGIGDDARKRLTVDDCRQLGTFLLAAANRTKGGGTCTHCHCNGTVFEFDVSGGGEVDCVYCHGRGGS